MYICMYIQRYRIFTPTQHVQCVYIISYYNIIQLSYNIIIYIYIYKYIYIYNLHNVYIIYIYIHIIINRLYTTYPAYPYNTTLHHAGIISPPWSIPWDTGDASSTTNWWFHGDFMRFSWRFYEIIWEDMGWY